jgi:hypothetical protein
VEVAELQAYYNGEKVQLLEALDVDRRNALVPNSFEHRERWLMQF